MADYKDEGSQLPTPMAEAEEEPAWFVAYRTEVDGRIAAMEQVADRQDAEITELDTLVKSLTAELEAQRAKNLELQQTSPPESASSQRPARSSEVSTRPTRTPRISSRPSSSRGNQSQPASPPERASSQRPGPPSNVTARHPLTTRVSPRPTSSRGNVVSRAAASGSANRAAASGQVVQASSCGKMNLDKDIDVDLLGVCIGRACCRDRTTHRYTTVLCGVNKR